VDRNTTTQAVAAAAVLLLVLVVAYLSSRDRGPEPTDNPPAAPSPADASVHLAMGNPSRAADDPQTPDNYLMRKTYFALSYNDSKGTANWVSWCLKDGDFHPAQRADSFRPDDELPRGFRRVRPADYTGTGFDRGHLCPNGDRMGTPGAEATFVMTNMVPQSPHCNQRAWADLEEYCRDLVGRKKQTLYVVAGPQGRGGAGSKGPAETISGDRVAVPAKCWKVVLAIEGGSGTADDVTKVGPASRLIAVVMPNDQSVTHGWAKYRTSAAEVEALTGYKFFDRVPAETIDPLKRRVDDQHIPPPRKRD
jgi:endonuclease G